MPRRYLRKTIELQERWNVPLRQFPEGEGPPLYLATTPDGWTRLFPGQGCRVPLDGRPSGAYAEGLVRTTAVVVARLPATGDAAAYCYHAAAGPLDFRAYSEALDLLRVDGSTAGELHVVLASHGQVNTREERFFTDRGVRPEQVFTYSNALFPHFGVSGSGCVGETR